jgi:hypothetical protein
MRRNIDRYGANGSIVAKADTTLTSPGLLVGERSHLAEISAKRSWKWAKICPVSRGMRAAAATASRKFDDE